jgi:hypothetical protein
MNIVAAIMGQGNTGTESFTIIMTATGTMIMTVIGIVGITIDIEVPRADRVLSHPVGVGLKRVL